MGWLDRLLGRRSEPEAELEAQKAADEPSEADVLEEEAHVLRDEAIFREPRKPPGMG